MPKVQDTAAQLAQLQRDREAIRAREQALAERERELLARQRQERAKLIADAFSEVDVGEVGKREAARLARAVKRHGIDRLLALIEVSVGVKSGIGDAPKPPAASGEDEGALAPESSPAETVQVGLAA